MRYENPYRQTEQAIRALGIDEAAYVSGDAKLRIVQILLDSQTLASKKILDIACGSYDPLTRGAPARWSVVMPPAFLAHAAYDDAIPFGIDPGKQAPELLQFIGSKGGSILHMTLEQLHESLLQGGQPPQPLGGNFDVVTSFAFIGENPHPHIRQAELPRLRNMFWEVSQLLLRDGGVGILDMPPEQPIHGINRYTMRIKEELR